LEIASQPVVPQPVAQSPVAQSPATPQVLAPPVATPPVAAPPTGAPDPAAPAAAFQNQDRFNELIERVGNKSRTFSETEQLDAYTALHDMAVTGGLRDIGADNNKIYNETLSNSAVFQKVRNLHQKFVIAQIDAYRNGGGSASQQAGLDFFDKLSPGDQDALFRGGINGSDMTGARPYTDMKGWRDAMVASIKITKFIEDASGDEEPIHAAARNPKIAAAIRLADVQAGAKSSSWIQQIADFLGEREPVKDKVDLSNDAKRVLATQAPASKAPVQSLYETGSVTSLHV